MRLLIAVLLSLAAWGPANAVSGGRSWHAWHTFRVATGHPNGWPGHVIDHVVALACGGADQPGNMQWQTIEQAKAKDRWERRCCL